MCLLQFSYKIYQNITGRGGRGCCEALLPPPPGEMPPPVEVRVVAGAGRGVFATRTLAAGEEVLRNAPAALVPSDEMLESGGCCTVCLGPVPPSAPRCRGPCRLAVLCRRCASDPKAAGLHEEQCLATAALFPGGQTGRPFAVLGGTEELRTALQLLELRRRWLDGQPPRLLQGWADGGDVVQDGWEDVEGLDDHEGGEDPQRELGRLVEMAKAVRLLAPTASRASLEQLVALLLRISCNGMGCHTREEMEIRSRRCRFKGRGRGVFPSAALLNHSCNPNCTFFLDDLGCITIQATRAVARGEELRIAYLSVATRQDTAPSRRAALASSYCFDCFCERCSRELAAERPQGARGTQGSRSAT